MCGQFEMSTNHPEQATVTNLKAEAGGINQWFCLNDWASNMGPILINSCQYTSKNCYGGSARHGLYWVSDLGRGSYVENFI